MTIDILNPIVTAITGLLIGTLLGNEASRILNKPRVSLRFKDMNQLVTKDGFFWSIFVVNTGRTVASNCIGVIDLDNVKKEDILEQNEALPNEFLPRYLDENGDISFPRDQLTTPSKFRDVKNSVLCWSHHGNPFKIDINPGMTQSIDICRVQYHETGKFWYFIFPSEKGWRKVRVRMKANNISGKLSICPANDYPTILHFKISAEGKQGVPTFIPIRRTFFNQFIGRLFS